MTKPQSAKPEVHPGLSIIFRSSMAADAYRYLDVLERLKDPQKRSVRQGDRPDVEWRGRCLVAGPHAHVSVEGPDLLIPFKDGKRNGERSFSALTSPRHGGTVLVDHARKSYSEPRRAWAGRRPPSVGRKSVGRKSVLRLVGSPVRLPEGGTSPLGETVRWMVRIGVDGGEATLIIETLAQPPATRMQIRAALEALFPRQAFGEAIAAALRRVHGMPVRMAVYQGGPNGRLVGTWQALEIHPYRYTETDFAIPAGYVQQKGLDRSDLDLEWTHRIPRGAGRGRGRGRRFYGRVGRRYGRGRFEDRFDDDRFNDLDFVPIERDVPLDAGFGLSHRLLSKLGQAASAVANVFDPLVPTDLRLQLDWFDGLLDRMDEVGLVNTNLVLDGVITATDSQLGQRVAELESLDDFPELRNLLTADQREALSAAIAELQGDQAADRWLNWTNTQTRLEIVRRYALEVTVAPLDADLRPDMPYDDPLLAFQEVDAQGNVVEDSGLEIAKVSFFREQGELYIYHLIDLTNITVDNIRPRVEVADDLVPDVFTRDDGFELVLANQRVSVAFDFSTEPAASLWMLLAALVTLSIAYWGLFNDGSGEFTLEPSSLHFRLRPRVVGTTIRHRLEYDPDASQVDATFWAIGWNPLNDIITLMASALVSAFDWGASNVAERVQQAVQDAIDERNLLRFPDAFAVGPTGPDVERDAASRIVGTPREVQALVSAGQSVFYRGIYGQTAPPEVQPLDRSLPLDGTYFFHRRVLEDMINARLDVEGRPLKVALPIVPGAPIADLIPDEIRNAPEFGPALFRQMVDLGMMTVDLQQRWLAYLEARRWLLSFEGMPGGRIPLQPSADGELATVLQGRATIQWADTSAPMAADASVAAVIVELIGRSVVRTRFRTDRDDALLPWLGFMEENVWGQVELPGGVSRPESTGAIDLFTTGVAARGLLHVGLWDQELELTPGFPASFDFAVRRFSTASDGDTQFLVKSDYATEARARAVRDALTANLPDALARLDHLLADVGRYASFADAQAHVGLHWRVVDVAGTNRFVRIKGDRLYLDFEVDPLIIENLGVEVS